MANKYWLQYGADAHWDTLLNNWWNDAAGTSQASAIPQNGDSVYLLGGTPPDQAPSVAVSLARFDTQGLVSTTLLSTVTTNITMEAGSTLIIGVSGIVDAHAWAGDATSAATILFQGGGRNEGTIGDNARFDDESFNNTSGDVGNSATFNSSATQNGSFSGTSYTILATTTFAATCLFIGTPPIVFTLERATPVVDGTFTSDGGITPVRVQVVIAAQADLVAANIKSGKSILGVDGTGVSSLLPFPTSTTSIGPFKVGSNNLGPYPVRN
jgi:hypothetical protein